MAAVLHKSCSSIKRASCLVGKDVGEKAYQIPTDAFTDIGCFALFVMKKCTCSGLVVWLILRAIIKIGV